MSGHPRLNFIVFDAFSQFIERAEVVKAFVTLNMVVLTRLI